VDVRRLGCASSTCTRSTGVVGGTSELGSAPALISVTVTATAAVSFFNQPSVASSLFGGIAFYCKSVTRVEIFTFGDMRRSFIGDPVTGLRESQLWRT
jgi:hypothetical protein